MSTVIGTCNRTGAPVYKSDVVGYDGVCHETDENLYAIEFKAVKTAEPEVSIMGTRHIDDLTQDLAFYWLIHNVSNAVYGGDMLQGVRDTITKLGDLPQAKTCFQVRL